MPRTESIERVIYEFKELSDEAKSKARQEFLSDGYPFHDWWDSSYEDFVTCGLLLGISIGMEHSKSKSGHLISIPMIYFSGFCCQGDGASFAGDYSFEPNAVAMITEHAPNDETLKELAEELTVLQVATKLQYGGTYACHVSRQGMYYHSRTMTISDAMVKDRGRHHPEGDSDYSLDEGLDDAFEAIMRRFADWIYGQLNDEYDYLTSDEVLDEQLADQDFDESGSII